MHFLDGIVFRVNWVHSGHDAVAYQLPRTILIIPPSAQTRKNEPRLLARLGLELFAGVHCPNVERPFVRISGSDPGCIVKVTGNTPKTTGLWSILKRMPQQAPLLAGPIMYEVVSKLSRLEAYSRALPNAHTRCKRRSEDGFNLGPYIFGTLPSFLRQIGDPIRILQSGAASSEVDGTRGRCGCFHDAMSPTSLDKYSRRIKPNPSRRTSLTLLRTLSRDALIGRRRDKVVEAWRDLFQAGG